MWRLLKKILRQIIFVENPPGKNLSKFQYIIAANFFTLVGMLLFYGISTGEYQFDYMLFFLICGIIFLPTLKFSPLVQAFGMALFFKIFGLTNK
jgi:hypothetical protein